MAVKWITSEHVRLEGLDSRDPIHAAILDRLSDRFVLENPVYWDARRFRRPCRGIPRRIELFTMDDEGTAILPRGARAAIRATIAPLDPAEDDRTILPVAEPLRFDGQLRDYQEAAVIAALAARDGVIQAPTGSGKTVVALALAARLATPAIILVHTSVLLEQTAERIRAFLGMEPGIIGGGRETIGRITVAMVQTLLRRDLSDIRDRFGLVMLDEAHHCPAETFKTVVRQFPARYRIGLTATPTRKDRLHPILYDVVGPIIHRVMPRTLVESGSISPTEVIEVETEFEGAYRKNYARLINRLVLDRARNALVIESIIRHKGVRSLVLSERVAHCHLLAAALAEKGLSVACLTGEVPREARDAVLQRFAFGEVNILVSTTALVGEGFDLPVLDTVFLTVPNGNTAKTTQVLGRALRPHEGKLAGRIVDFVDARVSLLRNQAQRRSKVYRGFGC
jgi:superfamily II DNA or RNA helicase